jgi:hypothetical protein
VSERPSLTWRQMLALTAIVFLIAASGSATAFALWLGDISDPQLAFLGSGNRLSLFVADGPARLVIASGDDPIGFENALARFVPLFARRTDVLLIAGEDRTLLVPLAAKEDPRVREVIALSVLPDASQREALGTLQSIASPFRAELGPNIVVTVETTPRVGVDPAKASLAWRATVERGNTRVVMLSDGQAAALFPPSEPASVLAVSGSDPLDGWRLAPAVALIAPADAISGPDLRAALSELGRPPSSSFRIAPGETVRMRFVEGGLEILAQPMEVPHVESSTGMATPRAGP